MKKTKINQDRCGRVHWYGTVVLTRESGIQSSRHGDTDTETYTDMVIGGDSGTESLTDASLDSVTDTDIGVRR